MTKTAHRIATAMKIPDVAAELRASRATGYMVSTSDADDGTSANLKLDPIVEQERAPCQYERASRAPSAYSLNTSPFYSSVGPA